jgi:hypothetical protein
MPGVPVDSEILLKTFFCWVLVAHTCNLSYSGGRNQEDHGSKSAGAIVHKTLSRKYTSQKGLVEW